MAKTSLPSAGLRARNSRNAKAAGKAPAARTSAAKTAAAKTPLRKTAAAKPPAGKVAFPKPPARKPVIARAPVKKPKPAMEPPPATEAEIMGAVSRKLSARPGSGGFSWLGTRTAAQPVTEEPKAPALEAPEPEMPPAPAPPIELSAAAPAVVEMPPLVEELVVEAPSIEQPAAEPEPPAVEEIIAELPAEAPPVVEAPASAPEPVIPSVSELLPKAAANEVSLSRTLKAAGSQLGWTLALQGLVFIAFCVLVKGGVPHAGLPLFLAGAVPVFAMLLVVAGIVSFHAIQLVLDKLEAERRLYRQLQQLPSATPDALTNYRQLAHRPSLIILGILFVAWLFIGVTVWFL